MFVNNEFVFLVCLGSLSIHNGKHFSKSLIAGDYNCATPILVTKSIKKIKAYIHATKVVCAFQYCFSHY